MMDEILEERPSCANETDKLCVMLAGLCHDLGHGPFSHLWERFVFEARGGYKWCHERTSIDMLDFIIEKNKLMPTFESYGLTKNDITFVKELIYGPLEKVENGEYPYVGRGPEKYFLYEIVANKISSVDVDKFDYLLRDNAAMRLGLTHHYAKIMENIDLTKVDGRMRICLRDKEDVNVKQMFMDRARFHRDGYQHKTVLTIDRMILDVLLAADEHLLIETKSGSFKLSEACDNMEVFCQLKDEPLLDLIHHSCDDALQTSQDIYKRILRRNFYRPVGSINFNGAAHIPLDVARQSLQTLAADSNFGIDPADLVVLRKRINMGMGDKNPIEKILFFDKEGRPRVFSSDDLRRDMPRDLNCETYFVLVKKSDEDSVKEAKEIFRSWSNGLDEPDLNLSITYN